MTQISSTDHCKSDCKEEKNTQYKGLFSGYKNLSYIGQELR